jgi:GntR family transcriptional regulator
MAEPMYRQIAEDLRGRIESGELAGGSQLPTEIELQEQFGTSRNTVRDAVKLLTIRGLVETRPQNANRIRLTVTVYPCDRNLLRVDVGAIPPRAPEELDRAAAP